MSFVDESVVKIRNKARRLEELDITKEVFIDGEAIVFTRRELFDGAMSVCLPEQFAEMDPEMARMKYQSEFRPQLIFTNAGNSVNFTFSKRDTELSNYQLGDCIAGFRSVMKRLHPTAVLSSPDVITLEDDCTVHFYTYELSVLDSIVFGIQMVFCLEGKLAIGGFICPREQQHEWNILARQVMKSISPSKNAEEES